MPIYDWKCNCGYKISSLLEMEDSEKYTGKTCVSCKQGVFVKIIMSPLVRFAGSGWADEGYSKKEKKSK